MPAPLNKSCRFPVLNTLRFIAANDSLATGYNTWSFDRAFFTQKIQKYFQVPVTYHQKSLDSDTITIYFDSLATSSNIYIVKATAGVKDDVTIVATISSAMAYTDSVVGNVDPDYGQQYYTFIKSFHFSDYSLADGFYYVIVENIYAGDTAPLINTLFVTECIQLRTNSDTFDNQWPKTVLFEYAQTVNANDVIWASSATPSPWAFRCECYLDIDPVFHDVVFENFGYKSTTLQSIPYLLTEMIVGGDAGVPVWVIDKVTCILTCMVSGSVTIDGVQWFKEPGANWSMKKYDSTLMKAGTIKLRSNPQSSRGVFSNAGAATFRFHDSTFDPYFD